MMRMIMRMMTIMMLRMMMIPETLVRHFLRIRSWRERGTAKSVEKVPETLVPALSPNLQLALTGNGRISGESARNLGSGTFSESAVGANGERPNL